MKRLLSPLLILATLSLCITTTHAARKNALQKEMEHYARELYRAHPEAAGDKKPREAREEDIKDAQNAHVLDLTKADEKKLRKRQDMVGPGMFSTALKDLKALNSKDPKITFLIKYAEKEKIKPAEKLLAYRLIQHHYKKAAAKAARERGKRLAIILSKYAAYKEANDGKAPASLDDLDLPEDCKKFTNSKGEKVDWIYIGHLGPRLRTRDSYVILAEPEPLGEARVCGLDNGRVINFRNSAVQEQLEQIVKAMKDGTATRGGGGYAPHPAATPLSSLMKNYMVYKNNNDGKGPASLDDLDLTEEEKQYKSPASGEKSDWIYLGDASKIMVKDGIKIVIVAPKAHAGTRLCGLSDGRVTTVKDSQIAPLLKR